MLLIDGLPAKRGTRAHGETGGRVGSKVIRNQLRQHEPGLHPVKKNVHHSAPTHAAEECPHKTQAGG